jgi:hypothetical protein
MGAKKQSVEELEEPSRAAGACVLVAVAGGVVGAVFAVDEGAGVLFVVGVGAVAVWRAARRRVSDSSAPPPREEGRPSCRECAGHRLVSVTPLEGREGMLIYKTAPADRPNHTHIHVVPAPGSETERTP